MCRITFADENRHIGKVLFIVEGIKDEIYLLNKIFTCIFNYQYEKIDRLERYKPYNIKENPTSSIFVINTKESSINDINDADGYLDNLFTKLINEYKFPVDKAAIFYVFDRDSKSNTDKDIFIDLFKRLNNSRDSSEGFDKPGLLLISYPSIESFTASNYIKDTYNLEEATGHDMKTFLHAKNLACQRINCGTVELATLEMKKALSSIGISDYDLDNFSTTNIKIFDFQENNYAASKKYRLLSLLCIALIDLRLIEIIDD